VSTCVSVERLVGAILRLTLSPWGGVDHGESSSPGVPPSWLRLGRLLAAFVSNTSSSYAHLPLVGVDEVVERAKLLGGGNRPETLHAFTSAPPDLLL